MPRICDYEGSTYRTDFWEGHNRDYEDGVERFAIKNMLPPTGHRLLEIGAGFGRLADLYAGYRQVVLLDYARSQLEEARRYLGDDNRFIYVMGDVYNLPFGENLFEAVTLVRVMHHLTDVPGALTEIHRLLRPDGWLLLEYANKRNLKATARWLLRLQDWSPFEAAPVEFVELNFNFHPKWMRQQLEAAGFEIRNCRTLSHYRLDLLKQNLPTNFLVQMDGLVQPTGNWWQLTPSSMLQTQAIKPVGESSATFFRCPTCHRSQLYLTERPHIAGQVFVCPTCQVGWSLKDGIYDFKTPLSL